MERSGREECGEAAAEIFNAAGLNGPARDLRVKRHARDGDRLDEQPAAERHGLARDRVHCTALTARPGSGDTIPDEQAAANEAAVDEIAVIGSAPPSGMGGLSWVRAVAASLTGRRSAADIRSAGVSDRTGLDNLPQRRQKVRIAPNLE